MPAAKPPEFRRRAVELAPSRDCPAAKIAGDLGIAESCLRRWMKADDVDAGRVQGLTQNERAEGLELRRRNRVRDGSAARPPPRSATATAAARTPRGPSCTGSVDNGLMESFRSTMQRE